MKKENIVMLIILALFLLAYLSIDIESAGAVCFDDRCVDVKIAESVEERGVGLMFVDELGEDEGMLFIFGEMEIHSFWMKNTLIPLDMIWIDEDFEVVDIKQAVPCEEDPCPLYTPGGNAKYVLEVNSGWSERNEIMIGNSLEINI